MTFSLILVGQHLKMFLWPFRGNPGSWGQSSDLWLQGPAVTQTVFPQLWGETTVLGCGGVRMEGVFPVAVTIGWEQGGPCPQLWCPLAKSRVAHWECPGKEPQKWFRAWKRCSCRQGGEAQFILYYFLLFILALYIKKFWLMDDDIPKYQDWDGKGFPGPTGKTG